MLTNKGQTLIEVIVVAMVGILVVTALTFAVIFSLRNASFAKNQSQATKLAQEGIERVRGLRDRNGAVDYIRADGSHTGNFNDLWVISFSCPANCGWYLFEFRANYLEFPKTNFDRRSSRGSKESHGPGPLERFCRFA
ncbi:MAG: hypothetical protein US99_C0027G0005 [Candidatus Daviesbacteria bacterium GW2011_GWF2_38_6]|uniref:Uncharacterized protein n=1 Tax=Candidatus Daviesbacteria bacterium GW2011_GWF2_38_6 TaxID=1618432 RepID=A0A0G0NMF0_9BACT|nr:MAG: hypothetical protein US99_C0027G0005 [Candidatus Daviesbacteria bacterium GW2011_GWF2_38_6]